MRRVKKKTPIQELELTVNCQNVIIDIQAALIRDLQKELKNAKDKN